MRGAGWPRSRVDELLPPAELGTTLGAHDRIRFLEVLAEILRLDLEQLLAVEVNHVEELAVGFARAVQSASWPDLFDREARLHLGRRDATRDGAKLSEGDFFHESFS